MKLIADMHTHTCASTHAFSTITENAAAAAQAGIKYLGMTNHGTAMPDSPHEWHFYSLRNIPRKLSDVYIIRGMEANIIDFNGNIDITDPVMYDSLEWIVASYHHPACMPSTKNEHTNSYIKVFENKNVCCIGHPDTYGFDFDENEVTKACHFANKAIELNNSRINNEYSIKRYKEILTACAENDAYVIVDTDSHFHQKIGKFDVALKMLEEIGFPERLVLNADEKRFDEYLRTQCGINLDE